MGLPSTAGIDRGYTTVGRDKTRANSGTSTVGSSTSRSCPPQGRLGGGGQLLVWGIDLPRACFSVSQQAVTALCTAAPFKVLIAKAAAWCLPKNSSRTLLLKTLPNSVVGLLVDAHAAPPAFDPPYNSLRICSLWARAPHFGVLSVGGSGGGS